MTTYQQSHSNYISRTLQLAELGSGHVSPNPMVGALLVCNDKIIGEGYHMNYGGQHAEVNAINNALKSGNGHLLSQSILYVSLEPCNHSGKTPPCTDLIIHHKIPHVIIGCQDPYPEVNGSGIKSLKKAGIKVEVGIKAEDCQYQNRRFITYHSKRRPYILLKFAQSADHFLAPDSDKREIISNELSDICVHRWRSEEDAILAGKTTVEIDNPQLTVRKWKGKNPLRITVDKDLKLSKDLHIFNNSAKTLVFNQLKSGHEKNIEFIKIDFSNSLTEQILSALYEKKILSLMVEGGANLLSQFIEAGLWDEARIITSDRMLTSGKKAPVVKGSISKEVKLQNDVLTYLHPVD